MKLSENMINTLFKEQEDGTTIYYAKGLLRKGYIVIDEAQKKKLYAFHRKINTYILPMGIAYALLLGFTGAPIVGFIPIVLGAIIIHFRQQILSKGLPVYEEKPTFNETKKTIANVFPKWFTVFMMINGGLATGMALILPFIENSELKDIGMISGLFLIMGIPLLTGGWYLYRNKEKKL